MWTRESRGGMVEIARKTKRYRSDLTDEEWDRIQPLLPRSPKRGRKPSVDLRETLNAIRYIGHFFICSPELFNALFSAGWVVNPKSHRPMQSAL